MASSKAGEAGSDEQAASAPRWRWTLSDPALDALVFLGAFAFFCGWLAALGPGPDGDAFPYLIWGKDLASGVRLSGLNPNLTVPKWLPILVSALCHLAVPKAWAVHAYVLATALAGAGLVALTGRLARRLGGRAAGLVAAVLVLSQVQLIRYVLNGQSTVYTALFTVAALVVLVREELSGTGCVAAGLLVFLAGMARQEAAAFGVAVGLIGTARLGWRRLGWPILATALGLSSFLASMLLDKVAFGSFGYSQEIVRQYTESVATTVPTSTKAFLIKAARVIVFFRDYSLVQFLMACVGLGLLLNARRLWQAVPLLLFPAGMLGAIWVMIHRSVLFNERCLYSTTFPIVALAAVGIAQLGLGHAASGEFLEWLPRWLRGTSLVAVMVAFAIAPGLTRPLPRDDTAGYAAAERACEFLRGRLGPPGHDRFVRTAQANHVFYRLGLPIEPYVLWGSKRVEGDEARIWFIDLSAVISHANVDPAKRWGLALRWQDPSGRVQVYGSSDGNP